MKWIVLLGMLVSVAVAQAATNAAPSIAEMEQLFMEAVMLNSRGFYTEAEVRLKRLVELQPDQPTVRNLLRDVQAKLWQRDQDPVRLLKQRLAAITLASVQFRAAKPEDVIDYIRLESGRLTADKTEINFVWQVPANVATPPITLNLKNVPLTDVLNYVAQLAGVSYRMDAFAVIFYKPEPVAEPNVKPE